MIDLQARYDPLQWNPDSTEGARQGVSHFISTNASTAAGLYWAEQFLLTFWENAVTAITNQTTSTSDYLKTPRHNLSSGYIQIDYPYQTDMKSDKFFNGASWVFFDYLNPQRYDVAKCLVIC
ncbi:hypothetical protein KCU98_g7551, partial [Aureobasidium melanogenum]